MIFSSIDSWLLGFFSPLVASVLSVLIMFVIAFGIALNIPLLLGWVDRKLSARMQSRYGPTYAGPFGILQNVADVIKLMGKRFLTSGTIDRLVYNVIPIAFATLAFSVVFIIPWGSPALYFVQLPYNLIFIYVFLAVSPFFVLLAGWGENNKYAMLGGFRGAAQITTYELALLVSLISIGMVSNSYDITAVVTAQSSLWNVVYFPISFIVFALASLAIIEREPFDLPEASQELQAGWKVEYSGLRYGLFFIGEYVRLLVVGMLMVYLFLGGWNGPILPGFLWFWIKTGIVTFVLMTLRWSFNRPRIDQLLSIGWNWLLPLSVANLLVAGGVLLI